MPALVDGLCLFSPHAPPTSSDSSPISPLYTLTVCSSCMCFILPANIKKVCFYIVPYPVRWTAQSALHFTPWQTCSFRHQLGFSGKQLCVKTIYSLIFPPPSIAGYSFIQLGKLGRQWRERKCPIFKTVANGYSNPDSLDCESGILPLSYRAPLQMIYLVCFMNVMPNCHCLPLTLRLCVDRRGD